jgi:hypothetical protein
VSMQDPRENTVSEIPVFILDSLQGVVVHFIHRGRKGFQSK